MGVLPIAALALVLGACGSATPTEQLSEGVDSGRPAPPVLDLDGDGLCDESEFGQDTDPADPDTDGDGVPDFVEFANSFDPAAGSSPAEDQLGLLEARPGATLELPVRTTVEAEGEGLSGFFAPITSFLWRPPGAIDDFFVRAVAVSADPEDNVRGIDYEVERFDLVEGATRLGFTLHFQYPFQDGIDCASAYPFRYRIKNDSGEAVAERFYILVVAPEGSAAQPEYCVPDDCY